MANRNENSHFNDLVTRTAPGLSDTQINHLLLVHFERGENEWKKNKSIYFFIFSSQGRLHFIHRGFWWQRHLFGGQRNQKNRLQVKMAAYYRHRDHFKSNVQKPAVTPVSYTHLTLPTIYSV